jgi:hypothetical protein
MSVLLKLLHMCYNTQKQRFGGSIMNNHTEELRKKYIENPPEGLTAEDIKKMSDDDLLDMDFFLHEDDGLEDDIEEDGFFIF